MGVSEDRDRHAQFDEFAVAAWPRLRWTAYLLCGDEHLAEDLAQTTLVKTYAAGDASAGTRRTRSPAGPWSTPTSTGCVDGTSRRSPPTGTTRSAGRRATDEVDDTDLIIRVLSDLTDRERRVLVLRHYWDLSEATVSAELGISLGTVKSTTSRALAKVRERHPDLMSTKELG